jgi:hypothetical protein
MSDYSDNRRRRRRNDIDDEEAERRERIRRRRLRAERQERRRRRRHHIIIAVILIIAVAVGVIIGMNLNAGSTSSDLSGNTANTTDTTAIVSASTTSASAATATATNDTESTVLESEAVASVSSDSTDSSASDTSDPMYSSVYEAIEDASESDGLSTFGGVELTDSQVSSIKEAINEIGDYDVGFVLVDINDMTGISYNADEEFYSASSIKGPYVASVVSMYPEALEEWSTAIENILYYSDNDSYYELRSAYGDTPIDQWCSDCGTSITFPNGWDYTNYSARTLALLWARNYDYFTTDETGQELATLYESPETSAIHEALGDQYTTQSKAGWIADSDPAYNASCDAGIIYSDDGPYILAVLSNVPDNLPSLEPLIEALDEVHSEL